MADRERHQAFGMVAIIGVILGASLAYPPLLLIPVPGWEAEPARYLFVGVALAGWLAAVWGCSPGLRRPPHSLKIAALALCSLWLARSGLDTGDADHCIAYAGHLQWHPRQMLTRLAFHGMFELLRPEGWLGPGPSLELSRYGVQLVSLLFGVGTLLVLRQLSGLLAQIGGDSLGSGVLWLTAGTYGVAQMGFCHVEVYPAIVFFSACFALAGLYALLSERWIWLLLVCWLAGAGFHLVALIWLSAILALPLLSLHRKAAWQVLAEAGLFLVVLLGGLVVTNLEESGVVAGAFFAESFGTANGLLGIGEAFSFEVLRQKLALIFLLNWQVPVMIWLVATQALIELQSGKPRWEGASFVSAEGETAQLVARVLLLRAYSLWLTAWLVPLALWAWWWRPQLGAEQDWDLYTPLSIPLAVWAVIVLWRRLPGGKPVKLALVAGTVVHSLLYLGGSALAVAPALPWWTAVWTSRPAAPVADISLSVEAGPQVSLAEPWEVQATLSSAAPRENLLGWVALEREGGSELFFHGVWLPSPLPHSAPFALQAGQPLTVALLQWPGLSGAARVEPNDHLPRFLRPGRYRLSVMVTQGHDTLVSALHQFEVFP